MVSVDNGSKILPLTNIHSDGVLIDGGIVKGFHIPEDEAWRLVPEFARDRDFPFFQTTVDFVLAQVIEYAKLKKLNEPDPEKKKAWDKIAYDLDKSELLVRLLEGKPMFTYPPPKSFKSVWYALLEQGEGIPMIVKFSNTRTGFGFAKLSKDDTYVVIDENSWEIKERISDEEFLVQYHQDAPVFTLRKATTEEQDRLLHPRQSRKDVNNWILIQEKK